MKALGLYLILGCMWMASAAAVATPLTLSYSYEQQSQDLFAYDFKITLDNHDGSWKAGQQFDWFIVGDAQSVVSQLTAASWKFIAAPEGAIPTSSAGSHYGPTVCFGPGCDLPGWAPDIIGDSFEFSGTAIKGFDSLLWSNLAGSTGTTLANFVDVRGTPAQPVPEPS